MKTLIKKLPALLLCLSLLACKKNKNEAVMPNYSTNGSNTFAAYVNGKLWLPKGRPSTFQSNLTVVYDPGYKGGSFDIRAYRVNKNTKTYEHFYIYMIQLDHTGIYSLGNPQVGTVLYNSEECYYERGDKVEGQLEITKLDLQNGIISGKFDFTLIKTGCDTIRVTEGRFDKKIF